MKEIEKHDQDQITTIVNEIRRIHEDVARLEQAMKMLGIQQEKLLVELDTQRLADHTMSNYLTEKYGPGALDYKNMSWVSADKSNEPT